MHNDSSFSAEHTYDSAHHSLAALLMARGETFAAGVVAISRYRSYCIDNLDGGQYEVTLEVPAEAYDQARGDLMACLRAACEDVVGADHYAGLVIRVLAPPPDPEWTSKLVEILRMRRVPSERMDLPALPESRDCA